MGSISPLSSVSATRAVLAAHGLTAKYSLGQNFLVNDQVLARIVGLSEVCGEDFVLEVGPGIGTLSAALLPRAAALVAVERDPDLYPVLAETCAPWKDRFFLVGQDALDLSQQTLRDAARFLGQATLPNKLIANLPYALAATLVLDCFMKFEGIESATVMVQSEVADRMCAAPGTKSYGAYTVKLSLLAGHTGRFSVAPGNFFPPPRVESSVLRLVRRPVCDQAGVPLSARTVAATALMADAAFANRRKTLANSCKAYFAARGDGAGGSSCAEVLPAVFEQAGIDPRLRGEALCREEFVRLGQAWEGVWHRRGA